MFGTYLKKCIRVLLDYIGQFKTSTTFNTVNYFNSVLRQAFSAKNKSFILTITLFNKNSRQKLMANRHRIHDLGIDIASQLCTTMK